MLQNFSARRQPWFAPSWVRCVHRYTSLIQSAHFHRYKTGLMNPEIMFEFMFTRVAQTLWQSCKYSDSKANCDNEK